MLTAARYGVGRYGPHITGQDDQLTIDVVEPTSDGAQHCLREYFAELDRRMATGFDPDAALPLPMDELRPPAGLFLVAHLRHEPIGCGGLHFMGEGVTEIKRMWVAPEARGLGVGRRLLHDLIDRAATHRTTLLRLDTNAALTQAIAMYRATGFTEVPAFNDEPHATHWFERRLAR